MIDLHLRAGNPGAMANAVPFLRNDGAWITASPDFVLDVIGPIQLVPAVFNKAGVQTHVAVVDERFHLNLRCTPEFAALVPETVRCYPATPRRVWA